MVSETTVDYPVDRTKLILLRRALLNQRKIARQRASADPTANGRSTWDGEVADLTRMLETLDKIEARA